MRREQGYDTASGGIAAAGAKWASPRPTASDSPGQSPRPQTSAPAPSATTTSSPAPAWGGAGLRTRTTGPRAEFPTLRTQNSASAPSHLNRAAVPPVPDATSTKLPDAPPPPVTPVKATQAPKMESDWGDDEANFDLSAPLALPEVSVEPPPPPPPPPPAQFSAQRDYAPRDIGALNRDGPAATSRPPVAAHWAPAIQRQQQHLQAQAGVQPQIEMPDRKLIEEQKNLMRAKAESAKEARRHAEEERERAQRERAAEKLRALEERLGSPKPRVDPNARRNMPSEPNGVPAQAPAPTPAGVAPKVLLRRPIAKEPEPAPMTSASTNTRQDPPRRRQRGRSRDRSRGRGRDNRENRSYERRNRPHDEPLENETREQWLERRRNRTEARSAARMVLETCIHRAVYGHTRGGRRRGGGRRNGGGRDRGDQNRSNRATTPPALALPSTMNPVNESVLVPTRDSPAQGRGNNHRNNSRRRGSRTSSPRSDNNSRRKGSHTPSPRGDRVVPPRPTAHLPALQPARPAPWAPKVPKVTLAPPVSSPGTRTVASVVDAVVGGGESEGRGGSKKGSRRGGDRRRQRRGGVNERMERERHELSGNNRSVEATAVKVAESTAAAATRPSAPMAAMRTVGSGPYEHRVLPSAGRGAGFLGVSADDAWSSGPKPTNFDEISRAFSNTKGLPLVGAPIIPTVPIIPTTATVTPTVAPNGANWPTGSAGWPPQTESVATPKWIPFQNTTEVERNAAPIPTVPPVTDAPVSKPPTSRRPVNRSRGGRHRRRNARNTNGGGNSGEQRQPKAEVRDPATPTPPAENDVGSTEGGNNSRQRRGPRSGGRRGGRGRGQAKANGTSTEGEQKPKGRNPRGRRGGGRGDGGPRSGSAPSQQQTQTPSQQTSTGAKSVRTGSPKPTAEG